MILVPLVAVICVIALVVGLTTFVRWRREVDAATAAQNATAQRYGFNPGNIISDGQFFNEHAMSQAEVQASRRASIPNPIRPTNCVKPMRAQPTNRPQPSSTNPPGPAASARRCC